MTPAIRAATVSDLAVLNPMIFAAKASQGYDATFMEACRAELTVTADDLTKRQLWLAEDRMPMGCIGLEQTVPDSADVTTLFVAPEAQGRGLGTALWEHMLGVARADGLTRLTLDADPNATGFYTARGCRVIGAVPSGSIPGRMLPLMEMRL